MLSKPVIAAVEGNAVAGGLELALWCDLRVAARDATFGVYCRRWGIPLCDGGTVRLPRLIGQSHALDMILTGRGVQGRRSGADGAREPPRASRARRWRSARARAVARALAADLPALGPQVRLRAVGHGARRCAARETELGLAVIGSGEVGKGLGHWSGKAWRLSDFA